MSKSVLIMVTNADTIAGNKNKPTGVWLSEAAEPYIAFQGAGFKVDIASPKGGSVPIDPNSVENGNEDESFTEVAKLLQNTLRMKDVVYENYDAIFLAGGHGAMFDFPGEPDIQNIMAYFKDNGRIISAVCHGPAAFADAKTKDGKYLVDGVKLTAFTNEEEDSVNLSEDMPFMLQTKLEENGAGFVKGTAGEEHVVSSGNFVTGQNPASSQAVAEAVINRLR
ncbi:type 1 glutamine amidotransferase domain-containing protein [Jeotgalicoccus nanhaiensis]|uniref:Type 1 glutamine amidotransferase domain-containing protein n=1 Tax=Jeotgalicoccus nanhaiensis TaxID=568603 RepID=A0ABR9XVY2_9STAP|nr:type 1 glutamine amidotransferase domain-containing protein [Jeotgalicoccus nanhaiensis]MBF0753175.1 type 1 glutamine amidotransferase domain-containing protein [Jeotgalicoccus nanhaiensis]TFU62346.1 type 1 glutamine amidotransferase domain-containing protein [Jeotgalicoccus nanhaiensis]